MLNIKEKAIVAYYTLEGMFLNLERPKKKKGGEIVYFWKYLEFVCSLKVLGLIMMTFEGFW